MTLRTYGSMFLAVLMCASIHAAEFDSPSQLYLKNGNSRSFMIRTIHPWGITNDRGESAMYRVIDSLVTTDSTVASLIADLHQGIQLARVSEGYMLSFVAYASTMQHSPPVEPLTPYSLTLLYRYDNSSGAALHYDAMIFNSSLWIYRFQGAMSFQPRRDIYATMGLTVGVGFQVESEDMLFSCVSSLGIFGGQSSYSSPHGVSHVIVLSPILSYKFEVAGRLHLTIGVDTYLRRERSDLPPQLATVFVGVGTRLQ